MTRSEFARVVADKMKNDYPRAGISYRDAKIWTVALIDCLSDMVLKEGRVTLLNFGTFETYTTKPHKRGDINSKSTVTDPPRVRLRFTASPELNKKVAELPVE